ncbi:DUF3857 domain-containing transglutaminase family protein [Thalassobellus citreus]|uniref:DUF3857 domain-containing transglutaminase family protein n=1 Tax=Thalassobellus citreus TaxID=3367752 RepID=UPI0037A13C93
MKNVVIAILITFINSSTLFSQVTQKKEPSWIDTVDYYKSEMNKDDVAEGSVTLLYDNQVNIPKQEAYSRLTTKIIDNIGLQNASTITINYDPTYQTLALHKVNIIRDGKILNKLDIANFQVMRREPNAEMYLYDGSLSAVLNISDVRAGDIIDYSFTIKGFNPLHKKFSVSFYLNDLVPIGKIHGSILSANTLNIKSVNTEVKPEISKKGNLQQYKWLTTNTKKLDYEENTPEWKLLFATVFVSEYNSWQEVVNWGVKLFKIKEPLSPELLKKIKEINKTYKTEGEKIKATLNFVQNDVRYLGLESGIGAYKPFSPNTVFERRFGDCKDKSLLMATMLNKMGITSYPMFVNTTLKHTTKTLLPSPKFFNHCVVKIIDGARNEFWYDPTISNQGGEYNTTYFPNYECGLVLIKDNSTFDDIVSSFDNRVDTMEEYTLEDIGKGANLKVTTTYYESEADNMRNYFKSYSISAIKKELESFYSTYYFNVSSVNPPKYTDNIKENIFTLNEEYQLDSLWQPMIEKKGYVSATFMPTSLVNVIFEPKKETRNEDYALYYPISRSHRIRLKIPTDWPIEKLDIDINSSGFYYELDVNYQKRDKIIDISHFFKTQKDYISPEEYKQYTKDINKLDQSISYLLYAPENYSNSSAPIVSNLIMNGIMNIIKLLIGLAVIIAIVILIYWKMNKDKD